MAFTFHNRNLINTSSQIYLSSGSGTAINLFDRKTNSKWTSVGESTDGTTATVSIVFNSATAISDIILVNHNFSAFNIIYDSNTANRFTPDLSVTGNTFSNTSYSVGTTTVNSIDINIWNTHIADTEKFLGELTITKGSLVVFGTNPNSASYRPLKRTIGIERQLLDGGTINIRNDEKFSADITLDIVNTQTFIDLNSTWDSNSPFLFVPFPNTYTANFEGTVKEVVWTGDFDIGQYRQNKISGGYRGNITLRETPR